jgi:hypothetical protein
MSHSEQDLERIRGLAAREEDFGGVLGRARAKARGVRYDPDLHHPDAASRPFSERVKPEHMEKLYMLIDRFNERGSRGGRRLPAVR